LLSPRQRRLAPLLLLLVSLVLLVLSRRTAVDFPSTSRSTTTTPKSSSSPSTFSSSSSLRLPPPVAAFHARLDDLELGTFNPAVVAASLREALAGGRGAAARVSIDDAGDDVNGAASAAAAASSSSSSLPLPDLGLSASFSALVRDIRAAAASSSSTPLDCDRDETLPALASLRLKKEGEGQGQGKQGGGEEEEEEAKSSGGNHDLDLEVPRLLLAANLKDSAAVLPHWLLSALGTGARLPRDSFFLSVVESGSEDGGQTRAWLSLLSRLGSLAGIRSWVAADASEKRLRGQDRISYLAALRNEALSPLWSRGPVAAAASAARAELEARNGRGKGGTEKESLDLGLDLDLLLDLGAERAAAEEDEDSPDSTSSFVFSTAFSEANRVAFVNDVFFCPDDVVRLLAHTAVSFEIGDGGKKEKKREKGKEKGKEKEEASSSFLSSDSSLVPLPVPSAGPADLACGLDLYSDGRKGPLRGVLGPWKAVPGEEILPWGERGPPLDGRKKSGSGRRRRKEISSSSSFSSSSSPPPLQQHDSLLLYDVWVSRDANGVPLSSRPPFARHHYSIDRAEQGLPFPVACCWNGLAAFSAAGFVSEKLRFRAAASKSNRTSNSSSGEEGGGGAGSENRREETGSGDCPGSSECSLLCSDLHYLDRWRAVLDPGVRVSYDARTAARTRGEKKRGGEGAAAASASASVPPSIPSVPLTSWAEVQRSEPLDWGFAPEKFHSTCCPKGGKEDDVVHWEGCSWGGGVKVLERRKAEAKKTKT